MRHYKSYFCLLSAIFISLIFMSTQCDCGYGEQVMSPYQEELLKGSKNIKIRNNSGENVHVFTAKYIPEYKFLILTPNIVFNWIEPTNLNRIIEKDESCIDIIPVSSVQCAELRYQLIGFKECTLQKYDEDELVKNNIFDYYFSFSYEELEALDFEIILSDEKL